MSSTTLMTFLLCTNPNVRSVKLLGSWDNFSKPYVMERDQRVGAGHWRGCHTFTNITCDGPPNNAVPARSGGLKMGGTYWYYYLLDDDVEYYNKAEPLTTHCPFLPGQPVNVLQVPVILPDTKSTVHARSPSIQNTMNPEDKYMNPREPPKPGPRLRTSPPLLLTPTPNWTFSTSPLGTVTNKATSQPVHGAPKIKHPRNDEKPARSVSPPRSKGLRAAFRQWNSNSSTPSLSSTTGQDKGMDFLACVNKRLHALPDDRLHVRSQSNDSYLPSPVIRNMAAFRSGDSLSLRRRASAGGNDSGSLTIQERRALNTKSPDDATPRNPLTLKPKTLYVELENAAIYMPRPPFMRRPLSTPSTPSMLRRPVESSTPVDPATPTPQGVMNKRLPTLPNSPSSVMDEALRDLDEQEKALDMEALGSHFSDFTDIESNDGDHMCEKSRFSEWSTDNEMISPESMISSSTFNDSTFNMKGDSPTVPEIELPQLSSTSLSQGPSDPNTPHLTDGSKPSPAFSQESPRIEAPPPRLTINSSPFELNIPGLCIDDEEEDDEMLESNPKRHAALFKATELKGLGLASPPADTVRFPEGVQDVMNGDRAITPTNDPARYSMFLSQSATMKEMMDELSYLRNMIQSGAVTPEL